MKKLFIILTLTVVLAIPMSHHLEMNRAHAACGTGACAAALFLAINAARVAVRLLARTARTSPRLEKIRQRRNRKCRALYNAYKKIGGSGKICRPFRGRGRNSGPALKAHCTNLKTIKALKKTELTGRMAYEKICNKREPKHAAWNRTQRQDIADCTRILRTTCK